MARPTGDRGRHRGRYLTQLWGGLAGLHLDLLHLMSQLLDDSTQGGTEQGVRLSILHPSVCDTCHPRQASPKVSLAQSLNVIGHGGPVLVHPDSQQQDLVSGRWPQLQNVDPFQEKVGMQTFL